MCGMSRLEDIVSLCKRRGFIFPGSDIYGGMSGTWDYGPLGVMLKKKIMDQWWRYWVEDRDDMYGVDAAVIMNPRTWVASGHAATFSDPLVECKECHQRFRADKIADVSENVSPDEFRAAHVKCPNCGKENWDDVKQFNMMFVTHVGSVSDDSSVAYLRPETAQGIFTNYKNVVDTIYPDLPFGLAQQGKAFRNEISPRDFVFRSREFEQMEIEYFVNPAEWEKNFESLLRDCHDFLENKMGLSAEMIHDLEVAPEDRAHYSKRTVDIEFDYPIGREELMGLAYRTDFDLMNIARESGKSMEYRDKMTNEAFVPHVIEPSFGVERLIMAVLVSAYSEDEVNGEKRIALKLPENLAPYRFCVSPLLKNKPELVAKAREVYDMLRDKYGNVTWDDSGNIGKRYRKQDEIGTPKCVVIDFDSLENGTVTVRDRDTMAQVRVKIEDL
ncbi:glycine--tRNA ligase [Candidatus Saccharibacteria bacterium]|nr:glycine--tRNA ligase [Candidatus Saccharibacteria bacterium]